MKYFTLWASQMVLVVKKPPAKAGGIRDAGAISELGNLEEEMASHSSVLA